MPMSFKEPPIPPFAVVVTFDGQVVGDVDLPAAMGTREQCCQFIAEHLPPKGGYEFDIQCTDTGRLVSYMVPASSVRQVRLTLQDLTAKEQA